jgi:hypothetical protein
MTELLDLYRFFVHHRQQTLIAKLSNPFHVSNLLLHNKFTNVQRIFDRVSQYELKNVLYTGDQTPVEVLKRIFLFNQFKTSVFWESYSSYKEDMYLNSFSFEDFNNYFLKSSGSSKMFTNAYVVPGKSGESKGQTIHNRCLQLNAYEETLQKAVNLQRIDLLFDTLKILPGIGDFLASQVCFDFLWHSSTKDWKPLYVLGTGAIRGATKLSLIQAAKPNKFDCMAALNQAFEYVIEDYPFLSANGVKIYPNIADIQNTFCESDKFLRLVRPDLKTSNTAPTRIKNVYKPKEAIDYCVPGHWVNSASTLVPIDQT